MALAAETLIEMMGRAPTELAVQGRILDGEDAVSPEEEESLLVLPSSESPSILSRRRERMSGSWRGEPVFQPRATGKIRPESAMMSYGCCEQKSLLRTDSDVTRIAPRETVFQ
jgi:hypothetical protein